MLHVFKPLCPVDSTPEPLAQCLWDSSQYSIEGLTRDVDVKPLHSHNDYWRKEPLFDALRFGCQSIESDIWLAESDYELERTETSSTYQDFRKHTKKRHLFKKNEIYVGHNEIYLEPENTLDKLYLDPLFSFLKYSNPKIIRSENPSKTEAFQINESKHGVFYNSPETPLYFWMDFKTNGSATYNALMPHLQRFIDNDYLAYYDTEKDTFVSGPLVITATGDAPLDIIKNEKKRYVFIDAPLQDLRVNSVDKKAELYSKLSVIASASMEQLLGTTSYRKSKYSSLTDDQKDNLKGYFDAAHDLGLKTRVWGGINWPVYIRNSHLRSMWELGCDLLNVDDLNGTVYFF